MREIFTFDRFEVEPANEEASRRRVVGVRNAGQPERRAERCASFATSGRFFIFCQWGDADAVRGWKSSREFKEWLHRVVTHATEFEPTEFVRLAKVNRRNVEAHSPPANIEAITPS